MRSSKVATVEGVCAVDDDWQAPFLALLVQRIPVRLVHTGCGPSATWIGAGVRGDKAEVLDAPLELSQDVGGVRRVAELR